MKDDNCIFCKLANGDIPTNSIYEDDDFKVILDASPATKGHALILPKQHYANIFEIEDETLAKAAKLAKKIMTHEKDVLGCEGSNLVQNIAVNSYTLLKNKKPGYANVVHIRAFLFYNIL